MRSAEQADGGRLVVLIAGPYSADSAARRAENLAAMNRTAAEVLRRGHLPVIGANAALPVLKAAGRPCTDPAMMEISLALAARRDAALQIGRSPGADREVALIRDLGRPVYARVEDLPEDRYDAGSMRRNRSG